jgi:hypothetical protein
MELVRDGFDESRVSPRTITGQHVSGLVLTGEPSQDAHGCLDFLVRTSTAGLGKAIGTLGHAQSSARLTPIGRALTPSWKRLKMP